MRLQLPRQVLRVAHATLLPIEVEQMGARLMGFGLRRRVEAVEVGHDRLEPGRRGPRRTSSALLAGADRYELGSGPSRS